jgi:hypothetical protein
VPNICHPLAGVGKGVSLVVQVVSSGPLCNLALCGEVHPNFIGPTPLPNPGAFSIALRT